eukprot:15335667-Ditylum_brightwellii.AAC.1
MGYMKIQKVFDDTGLNCNKYAVIQPSDLKKKLEARNLAKKKRGEIDLDMYMVQFGMKSTLVNFKDTYFIYWGAAKESSLTDEDVTLAIGGANQPS